MDRLAWILNKQFIMFSHQFKKSEQIKKHILNACVLYGEIKFICHKN